MMGVLMDVVTVLAFAGNGFFAGSLVFMLLIFVAEGMWDFVPYGLIMLLTCVLSLVALGPHASLAKSDLIAALIAAVQ